MAKEIIWHNLSSEEAVKKLGSDSEKGLSGKEVKTRQEKFGKNLLPEEKPLSKLKIFLGQFKSPLIYILVIAGILVLIFKQFTDAIVIFFAVFLNTIIGFIQENKASKTLKELKKIVKHTAEVLREGNLKIIDLTELVPGDIIILNPGDKVPADGRIIESRNLRINEMTLTGEWLTAKKNSEILPKETPLADRDNMVYMGCVIEEGKGKVVVTDIGINTEIGRVAVLIKEAKEEKTPYQKKIARFSVVLGLIIAFLCFSIFLFGVMTGKGYQEMLLTVIAITVAAVPECLPAAVTVTFVFGLQAILRRKGLVREMLAAETLGSTSVIATDKTGTLTEAKMKVAEIIGDKLLTLKAAVLTSEAFIENPNDQKEKWILRGRPSDKALIEAGIEAGIDRKREFEKKKIAELLFNPINKFAAGLYEEEGERILYLCGAPEKILELSDLTNEEKMNLEKKLNELAAKGLRIVATGYKKITNLSEYTTNNTNKIFEKISGEFVYIRGLTFLGFITLKDPIRPEVKKAMKVCRQAGMRVIIVTGDHKLTAKAIAEELGLPSKEENIIEGKNLDKMSDKELRENVRKIEIYARVEPRHKIRIIQAWQDEGEIVAMTGDGINDAPALKKANIGVALGSGTEVAKEASDLILLTDNFSIIITAVEEGRRIMDNIRKIITFLLTGGFTEIMLIGFSVISRLPLPVLPGQILWKNLIESTPPSMALTFEQREKEVMNRSPEDPRLPLLTKEMNFIIFVVGFLTNVILFGLFVWFLKNGFSLELTRSIMFIGLAIDSFFFIFSCRNLRKNIWQYNPFANQYLNITIIFGFLMLVVALYVPVLQKLLKTVPLGIFEWLILLAFGLLNLVLIEAAKWYFIKKQKV